MLYTKDKNDAVSSFNLIGAEDNILTTARPGEGDAVEFYTYTKDLREWQLGKLEGQKLSIIQAIYPKEMDAFRHNLANFRANNFQAESVYHTTKRVADLVRTLKDSSMKNVLLVGHGANLTASIRSLLGFEPGLLRKTGGLDNASVTILETDDCEHFTLKSWNDTSYRTQVNKIS